MSDMISKLWYRVSKAAARAVFNIHGAILEVILGVPPIQTMGRVISIKHYLKVLHDSDDIHFDFVESQLEEKNPTVLCHHRDVQKFLLWKAEHFSTEIQGCDLCDIAQRNLEHILLLPKRLISTQKEWFSNLQNFCGKKIYITY